jgi:hypothetical protein
MTERATIRFANPTRQPMLLNITDATGRVVYTANPNGNTHIIERGNLTAGSYVYTISGPATPTFSGRLNIH